MDKEILFVDSIQDEMLCAETTDPNSIRWNIRKMAPSEAEGNQIMEAIIKHEEIGFSAAVGPYVCLANLSTNGRSALLFFRFHSIEDAQFLERKISSAESRTQFRAAVKLAVAYGQSGKSSPFMFSLGVPRDEEKLS